jgi:hypothetical protein
MIDTMRLTIPSERFRPDIIAWLLRQQHKISKTDWYGEKTDWSLVTGLDMPSWFDGFTLSIGSRVLIEASPKIYQGHNITGTDNLLQAAALLIDHIFGVVLRVDSWPAAGDWYVARLDITYNYDFQTFEALEVYLDTVMGVQRGQRRAGVDERVEDGESRPTCVDAMPSGRTVYIGKGSRYRVGKIYAKGRDLLKHPPRSIACHPEIVQELALEFASCGRFEEQIRAPWLSRSAVKLGLLPGYFKGMLPVVFAENAALYLSNLGIQPLHSKNKKQPTVYFTVSYLDRFLNHAQVWESEFQHLFAKEAAMDDAALMKSLIREAKTPASAARAFDFYVRVRTAGLAMARQTVGKSQFYVHRRLLNAAGVSDAMLQDGAPLVRLPLEATRIRLWNPSSDRLRMVEDIHRAMLPGDVDRLHREVLKVA